MQYLARAEHLKSTFFFSSQSPNAAAFCITCTIYLVTFLKLIHHDNALTIPKDRAITFHADETLLNFLAGLSQGASIAYSAFWPQEQSDRPV